MKVVVVTPAAPRDRTGNRVTALRWAKLLRELGHRVAVRSGWRGEACDVLIALHARKSRADALRFARERPQAPLIVGLAGTDVYGELGGLEVLEAAARIVVLQPLAIAELPEHLHVKTRTIVQSAPSCARPQPKYTDAFQVACAAHLREVKDPLLAARAARRLPASSRIRVVLFGRALDADWEQRARDEMRANPRFEWRGPLHRRALFTELARSSLFVLTSKSEGGANALSEALALELPVLSTRIAGSLGLVGADHPGLFPVGDERALAELLARAEGDPAFRAELERATQRLRAQVEPARERSAWQSLLAGLGIGAPSTDSAGRD